MRIKIKGNQETSILRTQICIDGKNVDCWTAYSSVPTDIRRLKKYGWELVCENTDGSCTFRSFEEGAIKISYGYKKERTPMSEERREQLRQADFGRRRECV